MNVKEQSQKAYSSKAVAKQTDTKTERLDLRVTRQLKKRLTKKAKQLNVSRNQLVEDVLIAFLDR